MFLPAADGNPLKTEIACNCPWMAESVVESRGMAKNPKQKQTKKNISSFNPWKIKKARTARRRRTVHRHTLTTVKS